MNKIKYVFTVIAVLVMTFSVTVSKGQCTCDQTRLKNIMDNATITLLNTNGTVAISLSSGTTYYVRVTSTAFSCLTSGSGCASIAAPVTFVLKIEDGAVNVFGNPVPPQVGQDIGPPNYSGSIKLKRSQVMTSLIKYL
ncbi:MAG: hypothetical protein EBR30_19625 [Cytophagia bacterium]|nr:hypothetical protein [Cytophagia bacterium]